MKTKNTAYKRSAIKTAKELFYGDNVINKIKAAKDNAEISRILKTARIK